MQAPNAPNTMAFSFLPQRRFTSSRMTPTCPPAFYISQSNPSRVSSPPLPRLSQPDRRAPRLIAFLLLVPLACLVTAAWLSEPRLMHVSNAKPRLMSSTPRVAHMRAAAPHSSGVPPRSLPVAHRDAALLADIRSRTALKPRWPANRALRATALRTFGPAYSSIVVSHKLHVAYIPVFKAGTTSMMWQLAYLENNTHVLQHADDTPAQLQHFLHDMNTDGWRNHTLCYKSDDFIQTVLADPSYLKFGFVRNPYDRVVSAYVDKVLSMHISSFEYQQQMYALYGHDQVLRAAANKTKPTFKCFLQEVQTVLRRPRTASTNLSHPDAYETNDSRRDLHWRPQVELLHPDLIHLDFVGRFDRIEQDRDVVLRWMYRHTDRRLQQSGSSRLHSSSPKQKMKLFNELKEDPELRLLIQQVYKQDFERFQFSYDVPDKMA